MQVARTNFKGKGKWAQVAAALNDLGRVLNTMEGDESVEVWERAGRIVIGGGGTAARAFPWDKIEFGFRILGGDDAGKVRIFKGEVEFVAPGGWSATATETDLSVPKGGELVVWVAVDLENRMATIDGDDEKPAHTATALYFGRYTFGRADDDAAPAVLKAIHGWPGRIELQAVQS